MTHTITLNDLPLDGDKEGNITIYIPEKLKNESQNLHLQTLPSGKKQGE